MIRFSLILTASAALFTSVAVADDETISKVMKDGFKGDTSPIAKVLDGNASAEEIKSLAELIKSLHGTKAPIGEQDAYNTKIAELIEAMDVVAGGDKGEVAIERLDKAQNCKACHTDHRPKK